MESLKKVLFWVIISFIFMGAYASGGVVAVAEETDFAEAARQIALSEELVTECAAAKQDEIILVAVLTKPIFLRSEGLALEGRIKSAVGKECECKEVLISRDSGVYFGLKKAVENSDTQRIDELIATVRKRKGAPAI